MRISAKCDYACRALTALAKEWPNKKPIQIHMISQSQDIPMRYLVHILIQLKGLGLVTSTRGKAGGYALLRAPKKITLAEVMRKVCGPLLPRASSAAKSESVFATIWKELEGAMSKVLENITFDDILKKAKGIDGAINYHI
ncbi:MAG: Rrf2 family transcriptional regulator [Candidatus Omnitrophica bacterium]|nr:Rrf2 family transcriptional regulator [Candidatus Omnitrophota bacterium]